MRSIRTSPELGAIEPADPAAVKGLAGVGGRLTKAAFRGAVEDFYLTNPIARASAVMAELSALARRRKEGATGTHG